MENIVLSIHLILALGLIAVVLLQRSEGGGLGMGGGDGAVSGRAAANALTKLTWILAVGFMITSLSLTVIAARKAGQDSVIDRLGTESTEAPASNSLTPNLDGPLVPPVPTDEPTAPPAPTGEPTTPPAGN